MVVDTVVGRVAAVLVVGRVVVGLFGVVGVFVVVEWKVAAPVAAAVEIVIGNHCWGRKTLFSKGFQQQGNLQKRKYREEKEVCLVYLGGYR